MRHRLAIELLTRDSKSLLERTKRSYAMLKEQDRRALRYLHDEREGARVRVDVVVVVDERREQRLLSRVRSATTSTSSNSNSRLRREQAKDANAREAIASVEDASRSMLVV